MASGPCGLQAWQESPRHEGQCPESRCRLSGRYVVPAPLPLRPDFICSQSMGQASHSLVYLVPVDLGGRIAAAQAGAGIGLAQGRWQ
jgi:hypothetical protein